MVTIEISWEEIKFFIALCVGGALYGTYCYKNGLRRGWDNAMYILSDEGLIDISESGEVTRVSDKEFKKFRDSIKDFE